jgi:alkyl hydroperoxide reductase subunit AhpC
LGRPDVRQPWPRCARPARVRLPGAAMGYTRETSMNLPLALSPIRAPIGLSVDPADSHKGWEKDIEETQGQSLNFPVIADPDRTVSKLYDMVHPEADPSITVRSVFIIDPNKKVRLILTYPPSTGRNFQEILRVIDSLQLTDAHKVATPVN